MKKLFATFMLLMFVSVASPGTVSDGNAIESQTVNVCHDANGNWKPQVGSKCDPNACGCLFHMIEDFIVGIFE